MTIVVTNVHLIEHLYLHTIAYYPETVELRRIIWSWLALVLNNCGRRNNKKNRGTEIVKSNMYMLRTCTYMIILLEIIIGMLKLGYV
jgi:hypothetical protein